MLLLVVLFTIREFRRCWICSFRAGPEKRPTELPVWNKESSSCLIAIFCKNMSPRTRRASLPYLSKSCTLAQLHTLINAMGCPFSYTVCTRLYKLRIHAEKYNGVVKRLVSFMNFTAGRVLLWSRP